ncbi:hypothetical protein [Bacillus mycoides]|uniref:hypothetical protein n=1 Tax=Bacillus mycoides TaxID=1405 RepID=UPI001F27BE03|nr:hypothetical protein [Bacillus mycoides]
MKWCRLESIIPFYLKEHQSAATIDDPEQVQSIVSFCSMVHVPKGFVYVPKGTRKFACSLSGVSIVKETCQKTITVDNCGPVDVTLNLLKVVGRIPYMVNAQVQGEYLLRFTGILAF